MAKIFRTESLNLGGNLRLEASSAGAFEIKSASGSTLMSRQSIDNDISSLHAQRVADEGNTDSDISSLAAISAGSTGDLESNISSLQAQRDADEGTTDSDVSSLAGDISTNLNSINANKGDLESDVSSLQAQRDADEGTTDSDVSSLAGDILTNKGDLESDVSSLAALNSAGTGDLESDVSSLQAQRDADEATTDSDISSLAAIIATNDVVAVSTSVGNGVDNSGSISFGRTFASTPIVVAQLKSSEAADPIIACMVSAVSTSAATVTFADNTPSANYTVELIASIG